MQTTWFCMKPQEKSAPDDVPLMRKLLVTADALAASDSKTRKPAMRPLRRTLSRTVLFKVRSQIDDSRCVRDDRRNRHAHPEARLHYCALWRDGRNWKSWTGDQHQAGLSPNESHASENHQEEEGQETGRR
jgi:hypothetical protein